MRCVGPGQGHTYEFLAVPRNGAYFLRERDDEIGFTFELQRGRSNALKRRTFKLQVLCTASGGTSIMTGDEVFLPSLVLAVDGRIVATDIGINASDPEPWNEVAVIVSPRRSGIVLESLVVRD